MDKCIPGTQCRDRCLFVGLVISQNGRIYPAVILETLAGPYPIAEIGYDEYVNSLCERE
jgi:hypothetical protein